MLRFELVKKFEDVPCMQMSSLTHTGGEDEAAK